MIKEQLIFLNQDINDRETAIAFIIEQANELHLLSNAEAFLHSVHERERILPTSLGFKVAMPHGRCSGVLQPFVSFMKTKKEFVWDERNNNEVDFIFLIAVPEENENNLHLRFLSEISKKLMNDGFRKQLRSAQTKHEVFELLHEINAKVKENRL